MKKFTITLMLVAFLLSAINAQNGIANILHKEKFIFLNSIPAQEYTVVGKAKYSNSKKNEAMAGKDPSGVKKVILAIDEALEKVEKGKQDDFDGAIVYSPIKIELVKFNGGTMLENAICTVPFKKYSKKCGQKDIFFFAIPNVEFEEVKVIDVQNFSGLGQMKMGKNDIDNFLNKLYERACKETKKKEIEYDGIMMIDDNMVVNGFISAKTLVLIKYKE